MASPEEEGSAARQLLGIRGGGDETNIWKIRLQLMKPVTWVPLIWGVLSLCLDLLGTQCLHLRRQPCPQETSTALLNREG